ncbi:hypothetical protein [Propionibacterium australiense]|uniref:Uncharacterized protein n=1 Tax=Propionibacterium australiense TaxID=119981 RepID=A0A8B3FUW8_9ACTN|nr:hypothetical protein [Propionibacterium australiense]RLP12244.1 hypothetical protein D7U36_03010 [Propionibacterium australiense]
MSTIQTVITVILAGVAGLLTVRLRHEISPKKEEADAFEVVGGPLDGLRIDTQPVERHDILRVVMDSDGDTVVIARANRATTAAPLHTIARCIAEGEDQ